MGKADLDGLLDAAVGAVGGSPRPGQQQMAKAVAESLSQGDPLLVEAGTGTGKSLAYLVPAIAHALSRKERRVIVATATLALQRQLVAHDLPLISEALAPKLDRAPEFALLKGRNNYVCLNKINSGGEEEAVQDGLFNPNELSEMGRHVLVSRATGADSGELTAGLADRAARRCHRHIDDLTAQKLDLAAAEFGAELVLFEAAPLT